MRRSVLAAAHVIGMIGSSLFGVSSPTADAAGSHPAASKPGPVAATSAARPARSAQASSPSSGASAAERAASAQAHASGRRVEVVAKRNESTETFAEPNGTFTAVLHAGAVRARTPHGWAPIDTILQRREDGTVSPGATVVPMAFSGGGLTPLVRLGGADKHVELVWPTPLPKPTLSGDTATYADVLPGVDLRLSAGSGGFHQVTVVKTRAAAGDPRIAKLQFGLRTTGLTARSGNNGASDLVDSTGKVVFSSPAPQMWDSAGESAAGARLAGNHTAVGRFESTKDTITVLADQHLLSDPATVFPVSIDPDWWAPAAGWAKIFSGKSTTSYWNGGMDVEPAGSRFAGQNLAKVGQCYAAAGGCNGIGAAQSFFQFDITGLHGAKVIAQAGVTTGAEFNAHEVYAPTCTPPAGSNFAMDLYQASFDGAQGYTWANRPWTGLPIGAPRWETHGYSSSCAAAWVGWGVGDWVRYANDNRARFATFMLRANNENDQWGWKKFDGYQLLVHYDWPPYQPSNLSTSAGTNTLPCSGEQFVNNATGDITLRATASDPDAGQTMYLNFEWWDRSHTTQLGYNHLGPQSNPSVYTGKIPKGSFASGTKISWRAITGDTIINGPYSGWCDLTIDNDAPAAPTLTPDQLPTVRAGESMTVTARAPDGGDTATFRYGVTQGGTCTTTTSVNAAPLGGSATFTVTPLAPSLSWSLWVESIDRANNHSSCVRRDFRVDPGTAAVAHWPLDGDGTTSVPDSLHHHDGTAGGTTGWANGRLGDALNFDGVTGSVSTSGGAAVDTSHSFSVSAWARLDALDNTSRSVVSEDGNDVSGFFLDYRGDTHKWAFWMPKSDCSSCGGDFVVASPQLGVWTHLVGVYDATRGQISLYVNGTLAGTAAHTTPWQATGAVQLGRSKYSGRPAQYWYGGIDEVQLYDRVLGDLPFVTGSSEEAMRSEIDRLAGPPVEQASYSFDEGAGLKAGDGSGSYRTATLTGGASWTTTAQARLGNSALRVNGSNYAATSAAPAVRTDQSFTVMTFANLAVADGAAESIVGQDGPQSEGFSLRYFGGRWSFGLSSADAPSPTIIEATSDPAKPATMPDAGHWMHLTGVYDAGARQVRLYVNGALVNTTDVPAGTFISNVPGGVIIGRAKRGGVATRFFNGSVDEVQIYNGVLPDRQIRDASARQVPREPSLLEGAFERFASHDGRHFVGTGPRPPGFHLEGPLGIPALPGPNTRMIFSCRYSSGYFLDSSPTCSNYEVLGAAGLMYTSPPTGVPYAAVYRCLTLANSDHFVSFDSTCESTPDKVRTEFLLGYTRLYAPLVRYVGPDGDHWSSQHGGGMPAAYAPETRLGYVSMGGIGSAPMLEMCRTGSGDEFLWTGTGCDGQTALGMSTGWVWTTPPDPQHPQNNAQLFACQGNDGERFESLDEFCEGAPDAGVALGYVILDPKDGSS
ncbi:LamG-like jellyroll fold domain-containing protein [Streptomyces sp. SID13031]|uniref:LamG-like jellyroll fold domain-containing protein n=1 Tax=Streptomyces sp. SID13031 TaxID=2706046 RepID=UPI0013CB5902|nr:LamG-like jellyroll fold domain-containing protein [Streptomyces sp. SID13031]NEA30675.1 LamG domain-containing protein [Streptomyces sp. SID13031]